MENTSQSPEKSPPLSTAENTLMHADEKQDAAAQEVEFPRNVHGLPWFLTVVAILSANFLFALDNTIVADIQPAIVRQFGSLEKISWLSVAFLLAAAGTNQFWGDVYSRFSAKWTFCFAVILFAIGSAVCGSAPEINALIIGRAICGFGGAGMYIGSMTLLTVLTTDQERPLYLSIVGVTWGLGTVLGPIIGGAFVQSNATWRWAFYLNLLVGGICAPVYIFLLPTKNPMPGATIVSRLKQIDWIGIVLICAFYVTLIMGISFGGTLFAWNSASIIALFIVSGVILALFFVQQIFAIGTTKELRIFPLHFLKSSTMMILFIQVVTSATCVFIPIYFIPLYFQFVEGDGALVAGVHLLPFVAFQVTTCVLSGFILGKTGYFVPWYYLAGVLSIPGAVLMFTVDQNTHLAAIYGYEILLATGAGATIQISFPVAQVKTTPENMSKAIGFCTMAQLAGPALALSIANTVFLNRATIALGHLLPNVSRADIQGIISDPSNTLRQSFNETLDMQVVESITHAMSKVYILPIVAACMTLFLSFRFKPNDKIF